MSQINSNTKDDFQVVLLLSCFVGHPVCHQKIEISVMPFFEKIIKEKKVQFKL